MARKIQAFFELGRRRLLDAKPFGEVGVAETERLETQHVELVRRDRLEP